MKNKAEYINIGSMAIFGTIGLFVQNISLSSWEIAFFRAIIALVIISHFKLIKDKSLKMPLIKKDVIPLALSGIFIGANWIFLFESYDYVGVSLGTICYYFCPVIIMLVSPILFKEKQSLFSWICFIIASLGMVLIVGTGAMEGKNEIFGIMLALIAACLYASVIILSKKITSVDGSDKTICQFLSASIVMFIYLMFKGGFHVQNLDFMGIVLLIFVGAVHTGFAYSLYFYSISRLRGNKIAIFGYVDPLVAIILAVIFLKEPLTITTALGGALILGATLAEQLKVKK